MKPENIEYLFDCFVREKHSSGYDDVDGNFCLRAQTPDLQTNQSAEASGDIRRIGGIDPIQELRVRDIARQLRSIADKFESKRSSPLQNALGAIGNQVLQFKERCLFVSPNCGRIPIPVIRSSSNSVSHVSWRTLEKTAISGGHFVGCRGDISFGEGETEKMIEVEIIQNQGDTDIQFLVELYNPEGIEIGSTNPLTVNIVDHSNLYDDEKHVVENIINSGASATVRSVADCIQGNVTVNTFKAGLQFLCSSATCPSQEVALAFELLRLTVSRSRRQALINVVSNMFYQLPDLDDFGQLFE